MILFEITFALFAGITRKAPISRIPNILIESAMKKESGSKNQKLYIVFTSKPPNKKIIV